MRRNILTMALLIAASFLLSACGDMAANNTANRPANAAANNSNASAPANMAAAEAEIKKMANDGIAATIKGDTAAMEKIWSDNYTFIGQDGAVATRAQRLESMKSGSTKIESLSYDEINVRSNPEGTGALLIARATVKGTSMGKPVDGHVRVSQVWGKTKDGWRQVSTHVTNITGAAATAPAANANKMASDSAVDKAADGTPSAPKR